MYILYIIVFLTVALALVALLLTEKGSAIAGFVRFMTTGFDSGFSLRQILFLWKIGSLSGLEDNTRLFWSLPDLDKCISEILRKSRQVGIENDHATQELLSRLYTYRTKVEIEHSQKKRGLESTRDLDEGQRVRILLRGIGVFSSKVLTNTSKHLTLDFPVGTTVSGSTVDWENKAVSVYFWRHNDAGYVFDTVVINNTIKSGKPLIMLAHSAALLRSQKRKSIRVKCQIYAQLYLLKPGEEIDDAIEPEPGMKCLLEDISEDGAMIIIGGKASKGMAIKLQFLIHDVLIVMVGTVRAVEYNPESNQSRIHFEARELNPRMKNAVLTFVYNVLPPEEQQELEAIRLTEEDGIEDAENGDDSSAREYEVHVDTADSESRDLPEMPDFTDTSGNRS